MNPIVAAVTAAETVVAIAATNTLTGELTNERHRRLLPACVCLATLILSSSIAVAECDVPPIEASDAEIASFMQCMGESVSRAADAHDLMAARLRDLYLIVDGDAEKRLDANQKAWRTQTDASCPAITNDGAIIVAASACEEKRYTERSAFLDEILAGCRAGTCPVEKL